HCTHRYGGLQSDVATSGDKYRPDIPRDQAHHRSEPDRAGTQHEGRLAWDGRDFFDSSPARGQRLDQGAGGAGERSWEDMHERLRHDDVLGEASATTVDPEEPARPTEVAFTSPAVVAVAV